MQNFRPGAIERMSFGEKDLRKINKDIIYVSISGFGKNGPYSASRVYDPVIQLFPVQQTYKPIGTPEDRRCSELSLLTRLPH